MSWAGPGVPELPLAGFWATFNPCCACCHPLGVQEQIEELLPRAVWFYPLGGYKWGNFYNKGAPVFTASSTET